MIFFLWCALTPKVLFIASDAPSQFGKTSPAPTPSYFQVASHIATRLPNFHKPTQARAISDTEESDMLKRAVNDADLVLALGLKTCQNSNPLQDALQSSKRPCAFVAFDCAQDVEQMQFISVSPWRGGALDTPVAGENEFRRYHPNAPTLFDILWMRLVPWGNLARAARLHSQALSLASRASSEDLIYAIFFLLHASVQRIPLVAYTVSPTWEKGFANVLEFVKMIRCCGLPIFRAITNAESKRAIDMLNACDMRDQVGSYRVITSFETPLLEAFSLCILQRNNCFNCKAEIMDEPNVEPIKKWRGKSLDKNDAAAILCGHLDTPSADEKALRADWSWKVVVGANPAYDAFPCQHQIFYPGKASNSFWYDPVFLVETIDGKLVWRRRHYRVRPNPGSVGRWTLSTLDNGVISNEKWTIVDAADDLSFVVFHYSGAASVVGQSYVGALLCTADGLWPAEVYRERIYASLKRCDLEPWELYGHGPKKTYMWSSDLMEWVDKNPPPLSPLAPTEAEATDREAMAGF